MTEKELVPILEARAKTHLNGSEIDFTESGEKDSVWSKSFRQTELTSQATLANLFDIQDLEWERVFNEATNGRGNEKKRILTLHSSTLLALLCFHGVSENHPLIIQHGEEREEYTKCWFEIKNQVFGTPSNIDIVLRAKSGNLLFLESKFTEYLKNEEPNISKTYQEFYTALLPKIPNLPLKSIPKTWKKDGQPKIGFTIHPNRVDSKNNKGYLTGIKQCISHLIGISQGPVNATTECWQDVKGKKLRFGEVVYEFLGNSLTKYKDLYTKSIGGITPSMLSDALESSKGLKNHKKYVHQVEILPKLLTYQNIFSKQNKGFLLEKVAQFYDL